MKKYRTNLFTIIIVLLASWPIFKNINDTYNIFTYWDEAETLLHAKSILKNGYPRQNDPEFYHSFQRGAEFGPGGAETYHSWGYLYFAAAILKLQQLINAEDNYQVIRFFFYLFALISICPLFLILRHAGLSINSSALILMIIFTNNLLFPHLYYLKYPSFSIFFASLYWLGTLRYRVNREHYYLMVFAALGLYYVQWPQAIVILFVSCCYDLWKIFGRSEGPRRNALRAWLIVFILTFPHFLFMAPLGRIQITQNRLTLLWEDAFRSNAIIQLNQVYPLFYLFIVVGAVVLFRERTKVSVKKDILIFSLISSVLVIFVSTQTFDHLRPRHLLILLPAYLYMAAYVLKKILPSKFLNGRNVFVIQLVSLVIFMAWNLQQHDRSIKAWVNDSNQMKLAIQWLNQNSKNNDTIYANTNRETILLHTKLKLVNASDFSTVENGRIIDPIPLEKDPTHLPIEKTDWIFWDINRDQRARIIKNWANPDYVSLKKVPEYFLKTFATNRYVIYKNGEPHE